MKHGIETLRVGSVGTLNCLELARRYEAKFLISSTSECYGDPQEHPQKESYWGNVNPIGPRSVYDESKRFAEAAVMAYHRYHRVNDGRVISNLLKQALLGEPMTIYGNGMQSRSFCYVSDEIDGILRLAASEEHLPVNIGNPTEFTILDCVRLVQKVTGSNSEIKFAPMPEDDPRQRKPDITKARTLLGWEPKINLEAGLRLSLPYFKAALAGIHD
jgi:dTDP-glucose 4,6-dehydratase